MLCIRDIFMWQGRRYRLLTTNENTGESIAIEMDRPKSMPESLEWSDIRHLNPEKPATAVSERKVTEVMETKQNEAWDCIKPLIDTGSDIYNKKQRGPSIKERAKTVGCAENTVYAYLRQYWKGGCLKQALLPGYDKCGYPNGAHQAYGTNGRGAKPSSGRNIYQIGDDDIQHMHRSIKSVYMKDKRTTIRSAFDQLLRSDYTYTDASGKRHLLKPGDRPSFRQYSHFLTTHYTEKSRLKAREGQKDFERNHRSKLGSVKNDCPGVAHSFEIDATIADIQLVSTDDVQKIIGKPTLYLIMDRSSHLIVGFYVGFENPSWAGALEAIRSIAMPKDTLCASYAVEYCRTDWPATGIMPQQFIADRGSEMTGKASNQLSDSLGLTVVNLPSQRPDWKPIVECGFKLIQASMQDNAPGFDPVVNSTRRMKKDYEKDACLNIREFTKIVIEAIIAHNRKPSREFERSAAQILEEVSPDPISIWNYEISRNGACPARFSEAEVQRALLPRAEATVTDSGINFEGLFYTCTELEERGLFTEARRGRTKISIAYDPRCMDTILVQDVATRNQTLTAALTHRSQQFGGYSLGEIKQIRKLERSAHEAIEHRRSEIHIEYRDRTSETTQGAIAKFKSSGPAKSRSSRRKDVKVDRRNELQTERLQKLAFMTNPQSESFTKESFHSSESFSRLDTPESNFASLDNIVQTQTPKSALNNALHAKRKAMKHANCP